MNTYMRLVSLSFAAVALACFVSCNDTPSPLRPAPPPAPSPGPALLNFAVTGPTTVHIGETARFTAKASYTDGSERDVTGEAKWQVGSDRVSLTAPGEVVGTAAGESSVTAVFEARSGVISGIVVVPPGTYLLRGTVRDAGKPLHEAKVVVTSGPLGTITVTLVNGLYEVYGVAGPTTITVSKEDYQTETRQLVVTGHDRLDIDLVLTRSRPEISGRYTLTFTAATECTSLPAYARNREYQASVTQSGADLQVVLTAPAGWRFVAPYPFTLDRFSGTVGATSVHFDLSRTPPDFYYSDSWPPIFESNSDLHLFGVDGSADAPVLPDRLEGALRGTFTTNYPSFPRSGERTECTSEHHVVRLVR